MDQPDVEKTTKVIMATTAIFFIDNKVSLFSFLFVKFQPGYDLLCDNFDPMQ